MISLPKAKEPFKFYTQTHIPELTGLRASNLQELLAVIKTVPGSVIYYHTHRFLQQHQYLSPEPPNDFAYWITGIIGEEELGESLYSIDTIQYTTIRELRDEIIRTIEDYIKKYPRSLQRFTIPGDEFHFIKSVSFIYQTPYTASDLKEFQAALQRVTLESIYFHMFEARLRIGKGINDFSKWLEDGLAESKLANKIAALDPYTHTTENLRFTLVKLIEKQIVDHMKKPQETEIILSNPNESEKAKSGTQNS
ncbi:MAG: hypothetical protein DCC43_13675 [Candidatus Brocadia sp.]|uniref:Uncharacterized protein n=1 Tax=Candidatus Brocadia fulgida TaxID=380242 RepID=A0A0M2UY74_9BACT|nr:MAG: hypothetical protein BROFUL_00463 [Candidatus Brocadia fulgida]MCC6325994.1 hypothetical protein [Candidatus Brocadia sp.]MCE7911965.1 hypothetical protein [Candidatus Brocadia sp. AMX3]OQZ00001.1 MAG: hypothetical protein B6D35_08000 [Candidatus Brocadia sp. UTAMX2]MBV6519869.1 hypothetical protein [Candidatus Brocadia fulgida]